MPNLDNTCYINSVLQVIINCTDSFISELSDFYENSKSKNLYVTNSLVELVKSYKSSDYKSLCYLIKLFKFNIGVNFKKFMSNDQQDAMEFLSIIIDLLDKELEQSKFLNLIDKIFNIELVQSYYCETCKMRSNTLNVKSFYLILNLFGKEIIGQNLQDLIFDYFKAETRASTCENCRSKELIYISAVSKPPKVLILNLNRFDVNGKRHDEIDIPIDLILPNSVQKENY